MDQGEGLRAKSRTKDEEEQLTGFVKGAARRRIFYFMLFYFI